jgi:hypothetical protein
MEFDRVKVRFFKEIEVDVYVPKGFNGIEEIAKREADRGLYSWDQGDWESQCGPALRCAISDEILKVQFKDALVLSDCQKDFALPQNAKWWQKS